MRSSCTLAVTLKQHTPLIHFQYKKDTENSARLQNSTLRATEVKPKLDKFIVAQIEQTNGQIHSHWYVGKEEDKALNYKLSIVPETTRIPKIESIGTFKKDVYGSYFGDAKGITWEDGLILTFTSFETDVLDAIYQYIVSFFVLHNFGQRQTKGFGSFTVDKVNNSPIPSYEQGQQFGSIDVEKIMKQRYPIFYKYQNKNNAPLSIIHEEYQFLKAGKNHNGYEKSKLFRYFIESSPRIRWEKRKIKQAIKPITGRFPFQASLLMKKKEPIDYNPNSVDNTEYNPDSFDKRYYNHFEDSHEEIESYRYIRALLGLAENNEYQTDRNSLYLVTIDHKPDSGNKSDTIERLASPILFKVFDDTLYLIPQPMNPIIYNQLFQFSVQPKGQSEHKTDLVKLRTPASFDLLAFLDYALLGKGAKKIVWSKIA